MCVCVCVCACVINQPFPLSRIQYKVKFNQLNSRVGLPSLKNTGFKQIYIEIDRNLNTETLKEK